MRARILCINQYTKFWSAYSFTNYKDKIAGKKIRNGSHYYDHALFSVVCYHILGFDIVNRNAKFDDSSFSRLIDIIGWVKV